MEFIINAIIAIISALIGGIIGNFYQKEAQTHLALIKAKKELDEALFKEKMVIESNKREPDTNFLNAMTEQNKAYRNICRLLSPNQKIKFEEKWNKYINSINESMEPLKRMGFKTKDGEIGYKNRRKVESNIDSLLEELK